MLRYLVPAPWLGDNHHCENMKIRKAPAIADAFFYAVSDCLEAELHAQTEIVEV